MQYVKYVLLGTLFGFILTKSQLISWFRWQEMFRFESFHLYGIMFSAVFFGALGLGLIKKWKINDLYGRPIRLANKEKAFMRYALGGLIFGLGWAMAGCPGAHYALVGHGYAKAILLLLSAIGGTWVYGALRHRLPH